MHSPHLSVSYNQLIRIVLEGLSETPLHFIFQYKGDSMGRYRRYRCRCICIEGEPLYMPELLLFGGWL